MSESYAAEGSLELSSAGTRGVMSTGSSGTINSFSRGSVAPSLLTSTRRATVRNTLSQEVKSRKFDGSEEWSLSWPSVISGMMMRDL